MYRPSKFTLSAVALASMLAVAPQAHAGAKNIFMMISDGASFGAWEAADLYSNGTAASSSYYGAGFSKYLMTTYPLNTKLSPTGDMTPMVSYDPAQAWGLTSYNTSSGYLHQNAVDSAAAGTALSTRPKDLQQCDELEQHERGDYADPAGTGQSQRQGRRHHFDGGVVARHTRGVRERPRH